MNPWGEYKTMHPLDIIKRTRDNAKQELEIARREMQEIQSEVRRIADKVESLSETVDKFSVWIATHEDEEEDDGTIPF